MCWRIVRIDGEGNIKIILQDKDYECNNSSFTGNWSIGIGTFGHTYYDFYKEGEDSLTTLIIMDDYNNSSMSSAFKNFQTGPLLSYLDKLNSGSWCIADKGYSRSGSYPNYTYTELTSGQIFDLKNNYRGNGNNTEEIYYDSWVRLAGDNVNGYNPTLKCNGTVMNDWDDGDNETDPTPMYVGTITADEVVYAGEKVSNDNDNENYYLMDYVTNCLWTLSPAYFPVAYKDAMFYLDSSYGFSGYDIDYDYDLRPAVSIKSGTTISGGDGTKANAYKVN